MSAATQTTLSPFWHPRRFVHANLFVGNLDQSMTFYTAVAGLEEVYRRPQVKAGFLSNGNTHHDIGVIEVTSSLSRSKVAALNHIAFEMENEVELVEGYRRAIAARHKFSRTVDHDITRSVYDSDPDGNGVEFYSDTTKNWRTQRTGIVTKPTQQWTPGEPAPSPEHNYHIDPEIRRVEGAIFHPKRITHAVFATADMGALRGYYTQVVGLRSVVRGAGFEALSGARGARDIGLIAASPFRAPGLHHVGFEVWDEADLEQSLFRARAEGIAVEADLDHPRRRSVIVRDSDGFRLQFYADRQDGPHDLGGLSADAALYLM